MRFTFVVLSALGVGLHASSIKHHVTTDSCEVAIGELVDALRAPALKSESEISRKDGIEDFETRMDAPDRIRPMGSAEMGEYWVRKFRGMMSNGPLNNCEDRWCSLMTAVVHKALSAGGTQAVDRVLQHMNEMLRKSDPCDDATYAQQYAKARDTGSISKFLVRERISSDKGYGYCDQAIESLEKLMDPIEDRKKNNLVLGANSFAIAAAFKQDELKHDGLEQACFEPICVLGLRIARELILNKDDSAMSSASLEQYDTLLAMITRLNEHSGNLCDQEDLPGLVNNWKTMAHMKN